MNTTDLINWGLPEAKKRCEKCDKAECDRFHPDLTSQTVILTCFILNGGVGPIEKGVNNIIT